MRLAIVQQPAGYEPKQPPLRFSGMKRSGEEQVVQGRAGQPSVIDPRGQFFSRASGGDLLHTYSSTAMRSSGDQGAHLSVNVSAEGTQYSTGDPGVFAGASNICASHGNNGPNLLAGSGPLTRDSRQIRQSPDYGLVNCSSGHGTSWNPLVRQSH